MKKFLKVLLLIYFPFLRGEEASHSPLKIFTMDEYDAPHPILAKSELTKRIARLVQEPLLTISRDGRLSSAALEHIPNPSQVKGGHTKSLFLRLRKGFLWDNGSQVINQDVIFAWKVAKSLRPEVVANILEIVPSTQDYLGFVVKFDRPLLFVLEDLSRFYPLPSKVEEGLFDADYEKTSLFVRSPNLIGLYSGRYRVEEWKRSEKIRLSPQKHLLKEKAAIEFQYALPQNLSQSLRDNKMFDIAPQVTQQTPENYDTRWFETSIGVFVEMNDDGGQDAVFSQLLDPKMLQDLPQSMKPYTGMPSGMVHQGPRNEKLISSKLASQLKGSEKLHVVFNSDDAMLGSIAQSLKDRFEYYGIELQLKPESPSKLFDGMITKKKFKNLALFTYPLALPTYVLAAFCQNYVFNRNQFGSSPEEVCPAFKKKPEVIKDIARMMFDPLGERLSLSVKQLRSSKVLFTVQKPLLVKKGVQIPFEDILFQDVF